MDNEEKKIKQQVAIAERQVDCKQLTVTEKDNDLCRQHGYLSCIAKFYCNKGEGMTSRFCKFG